MMAKFKTGQKFNTPKRNASHVETFSTKNGC